MASLRSSRRSPTRPPRRTPSSKGMRVSFDTTPQSLPPSPATLLPGPSSCRGIGSTLPLTLPGAIRECKCKVCQKVFAGVHEVSPHTLECGKYSWSEEDEDGDEKREDKEERDDSDFWGVQNQEESDI